MHYKIYKVPNFINHKKQSTKYKKKPSKVPLPLNDHQLRITSLLLVRNILIIRQNLSPPVLIFELMQKIVIGDSVF